MVVKIREEKINSLDVSVTSVQVQSFKLFLGKSLSLCGDRQIGQTRILSAENNSFRLLITAIHKARQFSKTIVDFE